MNWTAFSEKFSKTGKVIIYCDPADKHDPFVINKCDYYEKKGYSISVRKPPEEKINNKD